MTLETLIRKIEGWADALAPKYVGTSVALTQARKEMLETAGELREFIRLVEAPALEDAKNGRR